MSIVELFCKVDDFCLSLKQDQPQMHQIGSAGQKPGPKCSLDLSEIMTIIIHFHQSNYRTFKKYYINYVSKQLRGEFPALLSYNRFVELIPSVTVPLCLYLNSRLVAPRGLAFIDSTPIAVCHNKRINRHQVFKKTAKRGKSSMGWYYGFKLHLVVDDRGELVAFMLTSANVDDRVPVPRMTKHLWGKLFGDKGYLSQELFEQLFERGLQLITPIRKNMKNRLIPLEDKLMARKRSIIETVNDQLKNISQIAHTRHRSPVNFVINLVAGLIAYSLQPKKPSLNLSDPELALLPTLL